MTHHKKPIIIGRIHAKWCGHCKTLDPKWKKMVGNIKNGVKNGKYRKDPDVVDMESHDISQGKLKKFNYDNKEYFGGNEISFDGFPTLFKVKDGKIEYYGGEREPAHMEKWFMQHNENNNGIDNVKILNKYYSQLSKNMGLHKGGRNRYYKKTHKTRTRKNCTRKNRTYKNRIGK